MVKTEQELTPATHIAGFVLNDLADGLPDAEVEAVRSDADPGCTGCLVERARRATGVRGAGAAA